jgi:hypothetical protein
MCSFTYHFTKQLTAKWCDGSVDGFDQNAFSVQLPKNRQQQQEFSFAICLTSSQVLVSSNSHPSSITSAESFVTYTPCSSHVVATCMTTYRSNLGDCGGLEAMFVGKETQG